MHPRATVGLDKPESGGPDLRFLQPVPQWAGNHSNRRLPPEYGTGRIPQL